MAVKNIDEFIARQKWTFAKTMAEIPHEYIVRTNLSAADKKLYDQFGEYIKENGYTELFQSVPYCYFDVGEYKYWMMDIILNRAKIKK